MADISEKFGLNYLLKDSEKMPDGFTLRDFFAAFALTAVVGLNLEDSTHESDAAYAYAAADAMLAQRATKEK